MHHRKLCGVMGGGWGLRTPPPLEGRKKSLVSYVGVDLFFFVRPCNAAKKKNLDEGELFFFCQLFRTPFSRVSERLPVEVDFFFFFNGGTPNSSYPWNPPHQQQQLHSPDDRGAQIRPGTSLGAYFPQCRGIIR